MNGYGEALSRTCHHRLKRGCFPPPVLAFPSPHRAFHQPDRGKKSHVQHSNLRRVHLQTPPETTYYGTRCHEPFLLGPLEWDGSLTAGAVWLPSANCSLFSCPFLRCQSQMKINKRLFSTKNTERWDCGLVVSKPALSHHSEGWHKRKEKSEEKTVHPGDFLRQLCS